MKTAGFSKMIHTRRMKTDEWKQAVDVKIKCEDCFLKREDPKINSGWLDAHITCILVSCSQQS